MENKEQHVDWDGLVYYDGKIKAHIDETVETAVDELSDRLDHESECLHGQVTDVESRVTIHDGDIRKLADKIDDIDVVNIKQEVTQTVINQFDNTIENTVVEKLDNVLDGDKFTTLIVEKVEEVVGTSDRIAYGSF